MRKWFTIKNSAGLEWDHQREEFRRCGTQFGTSPDAYDVAVELPHERLSISLNTNLDGNVRTSTIWRAK